MILMTVLIVAVKSFCFPDISGDFRIYYHALVAILVVVSCFEVVKYLYAHRHSLHQNDITRPKSQVSDRGEDGPRDMRDAYRLIYPPGSRPTLEVLQAPFHHPLEHELVIYDLSETGLGFHHDGLLPLTGTLFGRIRFSDGEYLEVAGDVVHHRHDRVGLALHCYIPHDRFMKEQRMLITRQKPNRLNLEVMRRSVGGARISHPGMRDGCPCRRPRTESQSRIS
ncbi:MAG: hypothetical protein QNJ22_01230 [Desulfosarcinaceae bacterium]|nr:hypothetical protein [Desulfosarcinaceae bacterium]